MTRSTQTAEMACTNVWIPQDFASSKRWVIAPLSLTWTFTLYIVAPWPYLHTSTTEQGTKYIMNHTSNHQVLEWSLTLWLVGKAWVEQVALMELSEWSKGQNTNIVSLMHYFAIAFLAFFTSCKSAYMCSFLSNGFSLQKLNILYLSIQTSSSVFHH